MEDTENSKNQIFKSKGGRISAGIVSILISLLFLLPQFFDGSALKFQITQKISQIYGANLAINGDITIALLPIPSITAEDVLLQNYRPKVFEEEVENSSQKIYNLYARSVQIKLPIFKFFHGSSIREIIFSGVALQSYGEADPAFEHQDKFSEILAELAKNPPKKEGIESNSGVSAKLLSVIDFDLANFRIDNIPSIIIASSEATFYDHLGRKREIKSINSKIKIRSKKIAASGNFSSENIISDFNFLAKFNSNSNKAESFLEVISPAITMRIKGNFSSDNAGILNSNFSGKIEAEILELKSFYKSYISGNSVIFNKLKYNAKPIKISAEINNKSREIAIENLIINSDLISGKGDIELNFVDKIPLIDIDLSLENIDLDNIWSGDPVAITAVGGKSEEARNAADEAVEVAPQAVEKTEPSQEISTTKLVEGRSKKIEPINFDFADKIKNFDLSAEIKVKNVRYLEGEIKDVDLYLTVSKEGEILILPMIFKIPGEGLFRVNGVLDNTAELPKFVGKFDANGKSLKEIFKWLKIESQNLKFDNLKEYSLYSDVLLLPNEVTLNNFYMNLNNGSSEFLGELKIDNSEKTSNITNRFQISNFSIDDYFLTSGQNAYLSPGTLIRKLLWLNSISANNDLSLRFDRLTYKGEEFLDQAVKLRFGRGYIELADLNLKSAKTSMKVGLAIDISDKKPKFEMSVSADNFHYEAMQKSKLSAEGSGANTEADNSQKKHSQNFLDQFFALPSLEGFGGKIALNFDDLKLDDLAMKNVKLSGKLKDGNLEDAIFSCDLFEGRLAYKGLLGIRIKKIINGNLQFNNVSLRPLLSSLLNINNISGIANISASITSSTDRKEGFAKELNSEIKFNANAPIIEGYGLSDLVKKMFAVENYRQELREPEKILLNPASSTSLKQANGVIQISSNKESVLRVNVSAPAVNGILSGTISAADKSADILFNAIFLTGSRQKRTPINIATRLRGNIGGLLQSSNLDQVKQYLGLVKVDKPMPKMSEPSPIQAPAQ